MNSTYVLERRFISIKYLCTLLPFTILNTLKEQLTTYWISSISEFLIFSIQIYYKTSRTKYIKYYLKLKWKFATNAGHLPKLCIDIILRRFISGKSLHAKSSTLSKYLNNTKSNNLSFTLCPFIIHIALGLDLANKLSQCGVYSYQRYWIHNLWFL